MTDSSNPLFKHFRQPAIYIKLPSGGAFWPEDALSLPVTGEIPVYSMTTKDEITLRTPDALLNGSGVVSVIQSCIPEIKDAWKMPSIDVDAILVAIRIASYTNMMEVEAKCPKCDEENSYNIDLNNVLGSIRPPNYNEQLQVDGLTFKFKPRKYSDVTKANLVNFEEQKLLNTIRDVTLNDAEKTEQFTNHLKRIVEMTNDLYADSIEYILTEDGVKVTNHAFIAEFFKNTGRQITVKVKDMLTAHAETAKIKPVNVACSACGHNFDITLSFDYSNFFA
jgi:hypothetical protein